MTSTIPDEWTRIPSPIEKEDDRRTLTAILASVELEVRIVKVRVGNPKSGPFKRFLEYRPQQ